MVELTRMATEGTDTPSDDETDFVTLMEEVMRADVVARVRLAGLWQEQMVDVWRPRLDDKGRPILDGAGEPVMRLVKRGDWRAIRDYMERRWGGQWLSPAAKVAMAVSSGGVPDAGSSGQLALVAAGVPVMSDDDVRMMGAQIEQQMAAAAAEDDGWYEVEEAEVVEGASAAG